MADIALGAAVLRLEDRPERRATVAEVVETADGPVYRLVYAEGGEGWWPQATIEPDVGSG